MKNQFQVAETNVCLSFGKKKWKGAQQRPLTPPSRGGELSFMVCRDTSLNRKASQRMHVHIEQATELPTNSHQPILPRQNESWGKEQRDLSFFTGRSSGGE